MKFQNLMAEYLVCQKSMTNQTSTISEVPTQPNPNVPVQPVTPLTSNPVAPTTGKENHGDKLPETGSQSDYISVLLGSGILLSLYVGRRKED